MEKVHALPCPGTAPRPSGTGGLPPASSSAGAPAASPQRHPAARLMVLQTVWLTALAALLDLVVVEAHWFLVGTVSTLQMRVNHHHLWMRPIGLAALIMPLGLHAAWHLR